LTSSFMSHPQSTVATSHNQTDNGSRGSEKRLLTGLRDRAMIAVGYDALCRRSELIALCVEDLNLTRQRGGMVLIRRSKNDPYGHGRQALLSPKCVRYLVEWLRAANINSGYIFCKIDRNDYVSSRPLHNATVAVIIKKRAKDARLPREKIKGLSGHSMRVGAAQDMVKSGVDLLPIMRAGGWKSIDMVGRYIEHAGIKILLKSRNANQTTKLRPAYERQFL
jgi:integrase/recombinase XerD